MIVQPRPLVFLGPSLSLVAAKQILPRAIYRPPARRGDLDGVDPEACDEVVLVDGVMVYEHPPSPSEVYRLVQRGVRVIGAASLGALRAVELFAYGVEGVGWVFEEYRAGRVTADDELVARLDPRSGRADTVFLINLRYALARLVEMKALGNERAGQFLAAMGAVHFEQRTPAEVRRVARTVGITDELVCELLDVRFDIKAKDAALALRCSRYVDDLAVEAVPGVAP